MSEPQLTKEVYTGQLRHKILEIEKLIRVFRREVLNESRDQEDAFYGQSEEIDSNLMLSIRHLEDARMRLGKFLQHSGDVISVYDK